ncbi:hypothetical protein [Mesorhizobium sp. M0138]|uniref:hypothetical protein n=1 Tax=Mesorhizobium sp. M0138 TaxID=2956891 RepID=UPI003338329E
MLKQFPPQRDYTSLSVRDLIEARDAYHLHLTHLTNVTATAVGRYRIHKKDWYATHSPAEKRPDDVAPVTEKKSLFNTVVRPWSWPCVLVFVDKWLDRSAFAKSPDQMVPRALFLPDGRVIPTCVVEAVREGVPEASDDAPSFPNGLIGGGFLLTTHVQGRDHFGSVGCLVSDGRSTFALTNQHVAGKPGDEVASILRGRRVRIGITATPTLRKLPFDDAYPGWPGSRAVANLDVGLVEVDDLSQWTTQVAGLGPVGTPLDLHGDNITVDLIDCPLRAFGGASGPLSGKVAGLFYRYKSMGGTDYISDVLIAPDKGQTTRPGDSGTLWCLVDPSADKGSTLRPMALQWGGHVFVDDGKQRVAQGLALGSFISTICRELDIDVLRGINGELPEYWGDVGHYTIGAKACQLINDTDLSSLMMANLDRIAYGDENISKKAFKTTSQARFSPLADVPDKVWKRPGSSAKRAYENPNHFADMDKKNKKGQTLLDLTAGPTGKTDSKKVTVDVFKAYYDEIHDSSRGLLPFRVWQLYDLMVGAASRGDAAEFVAAGGIMAHYVGDSCQPLHISYKFNGDPDRKDPVTHEIYGHEVHSAYESDMLRAHSVEMLARLNTELGIAPGHLGTHGYNKFCKSGRDAAVATVDVMRGAFATISPDAIIEVFVTDKSRLWDEFGQLTVELLAEGSRSLAMIWESAWIQGKSKIVDLGPVDLDALVTIYEDPKWAPSVRLDDIAPILAK